MAGSKNTPSKNVVAASADAGKKIKRKRSKSTRPNFCSYIHRVLKETHPTIGITKKSMGIMNDFVNDMMDQLAGEAKHDLGITTKGEKTLREWHLQTAVKLVLPGELNKHAISEGSKAVHNFKKFGQNKLEETNQKK